MALPVSGGMLIEPLTSFIVPTLYCGYVELKMRAGFEDDFWAGDENRDRVGIIWSPLVGMLCVPCFSSLSR